jgi:hypothetical protein
MSPVLNSGDTAEEPPAGRGIGRWFGLSAFVAAAVFIVGRLAVEPFRDAPQFDAKGMEAYAAVETFALRKNPHPFSVAMFGSSVSIWGIVSDVVADELGLPHHRVRKLAVVGGTPFDHWHLIKHNPEKFHDLRVAVIEINPRMLHPNLESDERVRFTISQHADWEERNALSQHQERVRQRLEFVLPLLSVRRSLKSAFLNAAEPEHGTPFYPKPDARLSPFGGWHVPLGSKPHFRDVVPPDDAARRLVGHWKYSRLQDQCLRKTLAWLRQRDVRIIFYEMPVHPDVSRLVHGNPMYAEGFAAFCRYVDSLGIPPLDFFQVFELEDCGVPVEGMRDLTHFNELGANAFSHWLGSRLRGKLKDLNLKNSDGHHAASGS